MSLWVHMSALMTTANYRTADTTFLRNSRKTECGARQFLMRLAVSAAPFALLCRRARNMIFAAGLIPAAASAQNAFTWQQIQDKFAAVNPTLIASRLNIDEQR